MSLDDGPEQNIYFDTNSFTNTLLKWRYIIDDSVIDSFKTTLKEIPISLVEILLTFNCILTDYLNLKTNAETNAVQIEDNRIDIIRDSIRTGTIKLMQENCNTDLSKLDTMFDEIKETFNAEKTTIENQNNLSNDKFNDINEWENMQNIALNLLETQHNNNN